MAARRKQKEDGHQAQKARATREKILRAVVELINASGYSGASSTAIAKQAGITWGAVQHHFGNKDEILQAVLELARDVYIESLSSAQLKSGSLEARIDLFVDKVWEHYKSDLYFAFSEIIMATRGQASQLSLSKIRVNKQLQSMEAIFDGHQISKTRLNEALLFVHRFLAGFAIDRILEPAMPFEALHIQRIKNELLALIQPT